MEDEDDMTEQAEKLQNTKLLTIEQKITKASDKTEKPQGEGFKTFVPYRKYIVYNLLIDDQDIIAHSVGGFIIGDGGKRIKGFVTPVNDELTAVNQKQFLRVRALGKLMYIKSKADQFKRSGNPRVELCFAVYNEEQ